MLMAVHPDLHRDKICYYMVKQRITRVDASVVRDLLLLVVW